MTSSFDLRAIERGDGPLDTRVRLVTPERIVFEFPLAGPFPRFCAYLIDQLCIVALLMASIVLAIVVTLGSDASLGLFFVSYFLLSWGYGAFLEGAFNGRTIGKSLMGLRVVTDQGVPISGIQAILRNVVGSTDGILGCYMLGFTSMFLTRKFQRLGDLAAGTMVIQEEQRGRVAILRMQEPEVQKLIARLPVRLAAGSQLTRALTDYVHHRHRFGDNRRSEMGEPLARPLRAWLGIGDDVAADTVLCAVYHRILVGE